MTVKELNIAIAEVRGWKWYRRPSTGPWAANPYRSLYHPQLMPEFVETLQLADMTERECNYSFIMREGSIPDYCSDLNVMHEEESALTELQGGEYVLHLWSIIKRDGTRPAVWNASAHQKAEALLKTIGRTKAALKKEVQS